MTPPALVPLTDAEIAACAESAGFDNTGNQDLTISVAVALAESGGRYWIKADPDGNGRWDHGLWQINDVHPDLLASGDPYNPYDNARMAFTVFKDAKYQWTPWAVFNSGSYKQFLPRAEKVTK